MKLACFDFDGTLARGVDSVMLLCLLAGRMQMFEAIDRAEAYGKLDWISSDRQKAALIQGLAVRDIPAGFARYMKPLSDIRETVEELKARGYYTLLLTAGPRQVAAVAGTLWGFDDWMGSDFEEAEGRFTGKICTHIGEKGKANCLVEYCAQRGFPMDRVVTVGDSWNDLPMFEVCGCSIAINTDQIGHGEATHCVVTDNLTELLPLFP